MARAIFTASSRSGSMFLITLTYAADPTLGECDLRINTAREAAPPNDVAFDALPDTTSRLAFLARGFSAVKIEDPGVDDLAERACGAYPDAPVLTTFRSFAAVARSHANIRPWGMRPEACAAAYVASAAFHARLAESGRLFVLPLDTPHLFDPDRFLDALRVDAPGPNFAAMVEKWPSVNTLAEQKQESGDHSAIDMQLPEIDALAASSAVREAEETLRRLCGAAAQPSAIRRAAASTASV